MRNRTSSGQTLSEYSFGAVLILVPAIAGLMLLGPNLTGVMQGLKADLLAQPKPPQAQQVADVQQGQTPAVSAAPLVAKTVTSGPGLTMTLSDGTTLSVENFPSNIKGVVEVSGINGGTNALLASLESLTRQLQAAGKLTPQEASLLTQLANQGHRIAAMEKILENSLKTETRPGFSSILSVRFEGKTYTTDALLNMLGWGSTCTACSSTFVPHSGYQLSPADSSLVEDPKNVTQAGAELAKFLTLYHSFQSTASAQDPVVKQTISLLVNDIAMMSEMLEDNAWLTASKQSSAQGLKTAYSKTTDLESAQICTTGGNQDSGVHCSG